MAAPICLPTWPGTSGPDGCHRGSSAPNQRTRTQPRPAPRRVAELCSRRCRSPRQRREQPRTPRSGGGGRRAAGARGAAALPGGSGPVCRWRIDFAISAIAVNSARTSRATSARTTVHARSGPRADSGGVERRAVCIDGAFGDNLRTDGKRRLQPVVVRRLGADDDAAGEAITILDRHCRTRHGSDSAVQVRAVGSHLGYATGRGGRRAGAAFGAAGDVGETVAVVDAATAWPPVTGAEAAATAPPPAITAAAIPPIAATRSRCLLALATVADARPPDELPGLPARAPAPDESSVELLPSVRRSAIGAGPFFVPFGTVPTG